MEKKEIPIIDFVPKDTANHFFRIMKNSIESLNYGFRMIDHSANVPANIIDKKDNFIQIQINDPLPEEQLKINLKHILLTKCFEDFIKGITLCLCDGFSLVSMRKQICEMKFKRFDEIEASYAMIYKKAQSKPLPNLIKSFEEIVDTQLNFKEEIISINKARNCLMHRDGIVYPEKDLNNEVDKTLEIKWTEIGFYHEENGHQEKKETGFRLNPGTRVLTKFENREKVFKAYEKISLEYRDLQGVCFTGYQFIDSFVKCQIEYLKQTQKTLTEAAEKIM